MRQWSSMITTVHTSWGGLTFSGPFSVNTLTSLISVDRQYIVYISIIEHNWDEQKQSIPKRSTHT